MADQETDTTSISGSEREDSASSHHDSEATSVSGDEENDDASPSEDNSEVSSSSDDDEDEDWDPVHDPAGGPPIHYDRQTVVRELTSFYEFLTTAHVPRSSVKYPPAGDAGWPEITKERFSWLGKTDTVLDLMKHLPYVYRKDMFEAHEVYPFTACVDYPGPYLAERMAEATSKGDPVDDFSINPDHDYIEIPDFMLVIASDRSSKNGCFWLLNTRNGTITLLYGNPLGAPGQLDVVVSSLPPFHQDDRKRRSSLPAAGRRPFVCRHQPMPSIKCRLCRRRKSWTRTDHRRAPL